MLGLNVSGHPGSYGSACRHPAKEKSSKCNTVTLTKFLLCPLTAQYALIIMLTLSVSLFSKHKSQHQEFIILSHKKKEGIKEQNKFNLGSKAGQISFQSDTKREI